MQSSDLASIISRLQRQKTDDGHVEVKESRRALSTSIWNSVSAFANTRGGLILLGLSEHDDFSPVADFDIDRVRDQFVTGIGDGGQPSRLTHPPEYEITREDVDGSPILAIRIGENSVGNKPCYVTAKGVNGGSFKRVDDKDIALSTLETFQLQNTLTPSNADTAAVSESTVADLDSARVSSVLEHQRDARMLRGTSTHEQKLERINVLKKTGELSLAGILALGQYPQQYFPRLFIDVTAHPTNEKSAPGTALRFVDRVHADGPLGEMIESALTATRKNLRTHSVVIDGQRQDQLEIPVNVLREAIANAVVHREYSTMFLGQPVAVDIFPDRVEITNPGGLWGGKTLNDIDDGTSRCRNQALMQLVSFVAPHQGGGFPVEGQGGGIKLMISEMESNALARPQFRDNVDTFQVRLNRHGAEIPEHREWLRELVNRELTPHEDAALVIAKSESSVSVSSLRRQMRIDSDEARELLNQLHEEGVLQKTGDETYSLRTGAAFPSGATLDVLRTLDPSTPHTIHKIARDTGRSANALRPILRQLIAEGWATATAPPTSRRRAYLAVSGEGQ